MKTDIHPTDYRPVIFEDNASGERFLIASNVQVHETAKWEDGQEYPLYRVEISSASHPFYTGQMKVVDTTGRVEKFKQRRERAAQKPQKKER